MDREKRRELMESCKDGDIPFVVQSPAPQVSFMPELCVFDTPCVFDDIEEARAAIDDPEFFSVIQGIYEDAGYQILGMADQCFRVMTSSEPFTGMESFKGQKIRTMENTYHIQFWNAVGASPTPMTFSEVYIGLQQGTIDGLELRRKKCSKSIDSNNARKPGPRAIRFRLPAASRDFDRGGTVCALSSFAARQKSRGRGKPHVCHRTAVSVKMPQRLALC